VNYPYDPTRATGTAYETGIVAPLVVAGPQMIRGLAHAACGRWVRPRD